MNRKFIILTIVFLFGALFLFAFTQVFKVSDSKAVGHTHSEETIYTCPMHPEIRQSEPGNCPICGMKLVKVENKKGPEQNISEGSLHVSPYQADLIGIKPVEVVKENVTYSIPVSGRIASSSAVVLQVFQSDLRYLKPGVQFTGHGEVYPEDSLSGRISSVDNIVDPSSRTVRVVGRIRGNPRGLLPEAVFTGQVIIDLGEKLVVPERAVLFTGLGSFAYIYEGEKLTPKEITLGPKVNDSYVVNEGLEVGDVISSGPNFLIDSESKIRGLNDQSHH
jgi:hypothetical protein